MELIRAHLAFTEHSILLSSSEIRFRFYIIDCHRITNTIDTDRVEEDGLCYRIQIID